MGEAFLGGKRGGGGGKLNDAIEKFKTVYQGQAVTAGDFVKYIEGYGGYADKLPTSDVPLLASDAEYMCEFTKAVMLDANRVLVLHGTDESYYYLNGLVVTLDGADINYGDDYQLSTTACTAYRMETIILPNGNILILHSYNTDYVLRATILKIEGSAITKVVSEVSLNTTANTGKAISAHLMLDGRIIIFHGWSSSVSLVYSVITVSDDNVITVVTTASISTSTYTGTNVKTVLLPSGNIFIASSYSSSNYYLYGMIVRLNDDNTLTTHCSYKNIYSSANAAYQPRDIVLLDDKRIFITYSYSTSYYLACTLLTISDTETSFTVNNTYKNTKMTFANVNSISAHLIDTDTVAVIHGGPNYCLHGSIFSTAGNTVTLLSTKPLGDIDYDGQFSSSVIMPNGTVFIAHGHGDTEYLRGTLLSIVDNQFIREVTLDEPVDSATLRVGGYSLLTTRANYDGSRMKALALDDTRVLVLHSRTSSYYMNGVIVTIEGTDFTMGADTKINTTAYTGASMSPLLLPNGNVVILHTYSSSYYLRASYISISDSVITALKTNVNVSTSTAFMDTPIGVELLANGNIFVAYSNASYLYYAILTYTETTLTRVKYDTSFSGYYGGTINTLLLPSGSVFITYPYGSNYLYGMILSIADDYSYTRIYHGYIAQVTNASYSSNLVMLDNGKVFTAFPNNYTYLCWSVITFADDYTSFTKEIFEDSSITISTLHQSIPSILNLGNNKVVAFHLDTSEDDYYKLYASVFSVNNTTATKLSTVCINKTLYSGFTKAPVFSLNNSMIALFHSFTSNYYLYGTLCAVVDDVATRYIPYVPKTTHVMTATESPFDGVALESGEGGTTFEVKDTVKIAIPNINGGE